ncbi:MAG: ATP-grasp domain-containing protein, partial [Trueperaceae bacterium]|nr:ATP-grasp domain-containing protein [Trueperaceae bacterium]
FNIIEHEKPVGVIVQLGGQTPLKLARALTDAGAPIWGTSADAIHFAEDRDSFHELCKRLEIPQPAGGVATDPQDAVKLAQQIGYPVMVRPSYVLGGRAMMRVHDEAELKSYLEDVYADLPDNPSILVDKFIEAAKEVDVDALGDGETVVVAGIMEHIEGAGIHSGDSACITPPVTLSDAVQETIIAYSLKLAKEIGVKGLINIQYVIKEDEVFIIEANPRASRTIPYLSKAIGHPLAKYAALIASGKSLNDLGFTSTPKPQLYSVKEVVLPFLKFKNVLPILGPEMRSTGESMGISDDPYLAYYKGELGANVKIPLQGKVRLIGTTEALAGELNELGFSQTEAQDYDLLIDLEHTRELRHALENGIPYLTTLEAAQWTLKAIAAAQANEMKVRPLQA